MISTAPIRFTEKLDEMQAFFEVLGFKPYVVSERPGWVEMRGGVSILALHSADHERSDIAFDTDEHLEDLQHRLQDAGYIDAAIVDEAYGRTLTVTDPQGTVVYVNERMQDTYGYLVVDQDVTP